MISGNVTYRKKTNRALEGLWVSGDQGGRFVFKEGKGNRFTGYLDTNGLCRIEGRVPNALDVKFTQHWLSTSAHMGAVAYVKGSANPELNILSLTYRCEKKDGHEIKGKSTPKRTESQTPKNAVANSVFTGHHSPFPPNVFQQFDGLCQKGTYRITASSNGANLQPLWTR